MSKNQNAKRELKCQKIIEMSKNQNAKKRIEMSKNQDKCQKKQKAKRELIKHKKVPGVSAMPRPLLVFLFV